MRLKFVPFSDFITYNFVIRNTRTLLNESRIIHLVSIGHNQALLAWTCTKLKIPTFSKSDDGATWWPNNYKKSLICGQLRNTQRCQKYVWLVWRFFLEFRICSSQQCKVLLLTRYVFDIISMIYDISMITSWCKN